MDERKVFEKPVVADSFFDYWEEIVSRHGKIVALQDDYLGVKYTYSELFEKIKVFSMGLRDLGLRKDDHVGMFSENSANWMIADQGMFLAGIVNAVRGIGSSDAELIYILKHSDSRAVFVQNAFVLNRLKKYLKETSVEFAVILSGDKSYDTEDIVIPVYTFEEVIKLGEKKTFEKVEIDKNSLATLIYTSGTTGEPKGVMLSYRNLLSQVEVAHYRIRVNCYGSALCVLPIWHAYERTCEYYLMSQGVSFIYTSVKNFKIDLFKYQPNFLISVPRIWESIYSGIQYKMNSLPEKKKEKIRTLIRMSIKFRKARRILKGICTELPCPSLWDKLCALCDLILLYPVHKIASATVYKQIKAAFSPNYKFGISGGGALSGYLDEFFDAVGIEVRNGYGLTEASPIISVREPSSGFLNSIGPAFAYTEIKVENPETRQEVDFGQRGVLMVRGPQVMMGYYKNPESTKKVISDDGWLNTGDLVYLSKDNNIIIIGREKETIVLSNGENIEPQGIEDACLESPYIKQIVLTGQDKPSLGALVVPDVVNLKSVLGKDADVDEVSVAENPRVKELIKLELKKRVQERPNFVQFERIANFRLLDRELSQEEGFLTQTGKIRRNNVFEYYKDVIEKMYSNV